MAHLRPPAVAGQFYEGTGEALAHQVEACFLDRRGPGELPVRHRSADRHVRAIIVPHAGLLYSGPIAALGFSRVAAERPPAHVLVLGVDHQGASTGAALSDEDWETPLGRVPADPDLIRTLHRPPIPIDNTAHAGEHSIEVELPFLQYVLPAPRFAALMVRFGPLSHLRTIGRVVREAVKDRDVLLVGSTDFSHYIPAEDARAMDAQAIRPILERDAGGLYETVRSQDISMCGVAPVTALLAAIADEPLTARLLRWGHSGESERMPTVVGYAAIVLESAAPLSPGPSAG
ncbi:MAG TPA: AmmeMemoRadiSam system protein B [Thermoplasmata archaeon]|nr:AmmeMemoRadiSam system protein B [Thermoplasmata archaeon]